MNKFVIRVYGICFNDNNQVLVTSENWNNLPMLKFPGGGLEWGEGTIDALKREFKEELNAEIEVNQHFYTTDFFQESAFNQLHQIISIYYLVKLISFDQSKFTEWDSGFPGASEIRFHWVLPEIFQQEGPLTFPIDRKVGLMVKEMVTREE